MTREDLLHAIGTVEESRLARCEKNRVPSMVIHEEDSKMKKAFIISIIVYLIIYLPVHLIFGHNLLFSISLLTRFLNKW